MSCKQQIDKLVRRQRELRIGLAAAILAATVAVANATDMYWNSGVSGNWQDSSSWSGGVVPGYGNGAYVSQGGTCTINSSTTAQCTTFGIGSPGSSFLGTVLQTGGSLDVLSNEMIGCSYAYASPGYRYSQSGGMNTTPTLSFGYSDGSFSGWTSTYNLNGGVLTAGSIVYHSQGNATFNLNAGTLTTGSIAKSYPDTTAGTATFNLGGGALQASADSLLRFPSR